MTTTTATPATTAQLSGPPITQRRGFRLGIRWKLLISFATAFTVVFDEMFTLAESFAEMAKKVGLRERSLTREVQRLKVEIDHARREEAVKEITESDFFSDLTAKAAEMRRKARPESEG